MGWTWVSDYQWGAIPYHYGTWVADPEAGWVWIPGNFWAPSWVVFRTGPDYIGWAPVPPGYSVGMSIDMGGSSNFIFVSSREFLAPRIRTSVIPVSRTSVFINNTTVVNNIVVQNNIVVNNGPDVRIVEKATGRTIRHERIESVARVAPFDHVDRAQLAVDPERVKRGVRVAEPVPATQPLPVSDKGGNGQGKASQADAAKSPHGHPVAEPNTQQPATQPEAVKPSTGADTTQKAQSKANAKRNTTAQADARMKADQSAKAEANAKASAEQTANAQRNANVKAAPSAKAQANAKAKADQSAKAQASAKAKAEAKAKKQNPDKEGQGTDQGATPKTKEETPQ